MLPISGKIFDPLAGVGIDFAAVSVLSAESGDPVSLSIQTTTDETGAVALQIPAALGLGGIGLAASRTGYYSTYGLDESKGMLGGEIAWVSGNQGAPVVRNAGDTIRNYGMALEIGVQRAVARIARVVIDAEPRAPHRRSGRVRQPASRHRGGALALHVPLEQRERAPRRPRRPFGARSAAA
jgi:hypothetical protein